MQRTERDEKKPIFLFVYRVLPNPGEPVFVGTEREEVEWRGGAEMELIRKIRFPHQPIVRQFLDWRVDGVAQRWGLARHQFSQLMGFAYRTGMSQRIRGA